MDPFWSFVISQIVILLGVAGSVWIGILSQTGPRRRVENMKLAAEALAVVKEPEHRARIERFAAIQSNALRKLQDTGGRTDRLLSIAGGVAAMALTIGVVVGAPALADLMTAEDFEFPVDDVLMALTGIVVIGVLAGGAYLIERFIKRKRASKEIS